ncbi:hypothetical protein [Streptomyces sp. NBC_01408]|uniref:hypothetical protein n=1 Tax=Streptomyces sp. NBC_01408 TaxID=2903855 RepID=UPI0022572540|nr:hypothetical protein [Streptomyces sp. NBC_01408]MCX4696657.1 hypothetical protein [Streptomyces sp. NBC_01408]
MTTPSLFTGPPASPSQVVRVRTRRGRPAGPLYVTAHGPAVCQGRIAYGPAIAVRVDGLPGAPAAPGVADAPEG